MGISVLYIQNQDIKNDVKLLLESKIPKHSIQYVYNSDRKDYIHSLNKHDLVITRIKSERSSLDNKHANVINWKDLPDLSSKLDVFLQLHRYLDKYPLILEGWSLVEVLHDGKDAVIYKAIGEDGKTAAIKRFKFKSFDLSRNAVEMFLDRVNKQCGLRSDGLVRFYKGGISNHTFYLVMEYLSGGTLRRNLNSCSQGLPLIHAIEWFKETATALELVHNAGLLHRDLKIDNIMLRSDGSLALMDYGVSKSILLDGGFLAEDEIHCSPHYVSPEQVMGQPCSVLSDIYSLGVIFCELLTGNKPYSGKNAEELMIQHIIEPVPKLPQEISQFQMLLEKMMAKDPRSRYQNVNDALADLGKVHVYAV